jgi:hypothetical protein
MKQPRQFPSTVAADITFLREILATLLVLTFLSGTIVFALLAR